MKPSSIYAVLLLLFAARCPGDQVFQSGPGRTSLIELFTSEGCSSCPPAEHWLSQLRTDPGLWTKIVPVAFHVTYWDRLGWADKFAEKAFTDRQYAYARLWRNDNVYTPCFVRDGAEWRVGDISGDASKEAGKLVAKVNDSGRVVVEFKPASVSTAMLHVVVALLASDVDSNVERGENAGRKLRHDFTVIQIVDTVLSSDQPMRSYNGVLLLPEGKLHGSAIMALAVWISRDGTLGPVLQAAGGWLKE